MTTVDTAALAELLAPLTTDGTVRVDLRDGAVVAVRRSRGRLFRSSITGRFVTARRAQHHPRTTTEES